MPKLVTSGHPYTLLLYLVNNYQFCDRFSVRAFKLFNSSHNNIKSWRINLTFFNAEDERLVELLLIKGASVDIKDDKGRTPLDVANETGSIWTVIEISNE